MSEGSVLTSNRLSNVLLDECCRAEYSNRSQGLVEVCKGSSNKRSEDVEDNGEVEEGDGVGVEVVQDGVSDDGPIGQDVLGMRNGFKHNNTTPKPAVSSVDGE